jgi:FkbM family methyltransferase
MVAIFPPEVEIELKEKFLGGQTGYFVEVGANDPKTWSQTWHLEQAGWTGTLVEPQPDLAEVLSQQRKAKIYAVACSSPENSGKTLTLHLAGIHSSLNPDLAISTVLPHSTASVPILTLDQILTDAGAPCPLDFVSIDVEGLEIDVLEGFDLERWRPRLLFVEDLAMSPRLHRYLVGRGYKWVRRTGLNAWYVPADAAIDPVLFGRWQFIRKYYLSLPFRRIREFKRRLRTRWRMRQRGAA